MFSDALNTLAVVAARLDRDWAGHMSQALEIALSEDLQEQAARAFHNFAAILGGMREFAQAERYFADGIAYCDEHDITAYALSLRGEQASVLELTGRWDESAEARSGPAAVPRRLGTSR